MCATFREVQALKILRKPPFPIKSCGCRYGIAVIARLAHIEFIFIIRFHLPVGTPNVRAQTGTMKFWYFE